jgi:hypothetical protein
MASTLLGGSGGDEIMSVVEVGGKVYLAGYGYRGSTNFPSTAGAYDPTQGPGFDGFVSCLNDNLTTLLASTFMTGAGWTFAQGIALESSGSVVVTGHTGDSGFVTTPGSFDPTYNGAGGADVGDDAFVAVLSTGLDSLRAATFLGGSGWEEGVVVRPDGLGHLYLAGNTSSSDFPCTAGAFDGSYNGGTDKYQSDTWIARTDEQLSVLDAATYLGGSGNDGFGSLCLTPSGVLIDGVTGSQNFPISPEAFDQTLNDGAITNRTDCYVAMLNRSLSGSTTGVRGARTGVGARSILHSHPEPTSGTEHLQFTLKQPEFVTLVVTDAAGRSVRTLLHEAVSAGQHRLQWDGLSDAGRRLAAGVYFVHLRSAVEHDDLRLTLVR